MRSFRDIPIKQKLTVITMVSIFSIVLPAAAFLFAYEWRLFRKDMVMNMTTLAHVVADNSTATLEFAAKEEAEQILSSLKNEQHIIAARLYVRDEAKAMLVPFASYLRTNSVALAEQAPRQAGHTFQSDRFSIFVPVQTPKENKVLGVVYLESDMMALTSRLKVLAVEVGIILCITLIIGWVVIVFLHRLIAHPLESVTQVANRIAEGDLTVQFSSDQRGDELGILTETFARMTHSLSSLVSQVQSSGNQVTGSVGQIATSARQQQSTANEIVSTVTEVGATAKEISATSKELVRGFQEVNKVAEATAAIAGTGKAGLMRMESTMNNVMQAVSSISSKLVVLNEKAGNINSVVITIVKVADQTNLLSLNAAIEAEKAGEYGRGFSVVAREVRRLADQTAVASHDIEIIVKEMQGAVSAGVMGIEKFSEEVRRGVDEVQQVSVHLNQIIQQVQTLAPQFEGVNDGIQTQAAGAQQISEALAQLHHAANQTAASLRQSYGAIEQLQESAQGLRGGISRFKLEAG